MNTYQIIDTIEKLETRVNSYWNFYTVVVLAVVGWVITEGLDYRQSITVFISNFIFFLMNLVLIFVTTKQILAFEEDLKLMIVNELAEESFIRKFFSKRRFWKRLEFSFVLHISVDIALFYMVLKSGGIL